MTRNAAGTRVESVTLKSGEVISCGTVVNASGPRAVLTSRMAGIDIPVEPRKRYTFIFAAERPLDRDLPLTIDPSGVHMRTDGRNTTSPAARPMSTRPSTTTTSKRIMRSGRRRCGPAIASRIPQFEAIKLINSWACHYAFNTLRSKRHSSGPHTEVGNFIFVNGFSGHGFQQSPAMGRGTAELITYGEFRTLDLTPFRLFDRIVRQRAVRQNRPSFRSPTSCPPIFPPLWPAPNGHCST